MILDKSPHFQPQSKLELVTSQCNKENSRVNTEKSYANYTSKASITYNDQIKRWQFLQARRQSQLNSMFNIRKKKLGKITKQNFKIYERINTQQSYYTCKENNRRFSENKLQAKQKYKTIEKSRQELKKQMIGPIKCFKDLKISTKQNQHNNLPEMQYDRQKINQIQCKTTKQKLKRKSIKTLPNIMTFY